MKKHKIILNLPNRTITRLSLYYKLLSQKIKDKKFILSKELAEQLDLNPNIVRKDLTIVGQLGTPGKGYETFLLYKNLEKILGIEKKWNVIIIGCGNLGSALIKYPGFKKHNFNIIAGFDISKNIIGKKINNIKIYHLNDLKNFVKKNKIDIAVITTPQDVAEEIIKYVLSCGIKGILNFTPATVNISKNNFNKYKIVKIDLTVEFIKLACLLSNKKYDNTKK